MVQAEAEDSRPKQRVRLTPTSLYYLMMVAIGATIGAIAGLSNTSVSNTLIELIASVVAGSAGLYFINRKAMRQESDALWRIGLLGLLFMAAFWIVYFVAADYRYDGPAYYKWKESASLNHNVALAEIYGHARKLGIADADLATALPAETPKIGDGKSCELLHQDARKLSNLVSAAYKAASEQSNNLELSPLAKYLGARFETVSNQLSSNERDKASAGVQMRDQAVATLLLLIRQHPDLAKPAGLACFNGTFTNGCRAATRLQGMLAKCPDVRLLDALATMRVHAGSFRNIWRDGVSTQPPKAHYTFETSTSDKN